MKNAAILSLLSGILLCSTTFANAGSILNATAYGDQNIECYLYTFSPTDQSLLMGTGAMPMDQYSSGTVSGYITTDGDPTMTIGNNIENDTGFSWTGYIVGISMSQFFTISAPAVSNPGWNISISQQPPVGGPFTGQLILTQGSGASIPVGGVLDFSYKVTFGGSGGYSTTLTPVPEPGTAGLVALGLLGGWFVRRRRAA